MNATDTRHGDAAFSEPTLPRHALHGFTWRRQKPAEPIGPTPLVRRTRTMRPVDAVTAALARREKRPTLPTRTPLDAAAMLSGAIVDAPRPAFAARPLARQRGAEAIVSYLRGKGIDLALSSDGAHVIPRSLGGRMFDPDRALVERCGPLLAAHLSGAPLRCVAGKHAAGTDDLAVSVLVGGAPCCAAHLAGGAS